MSVLSESTQQKVLDKLEKDGVIDSFKLSEVRAKALKKKMPIFKQLILDKYLDEEKLTKYVAHANSIPYVNLKDVYINQEALELLPKDLAQLYMAVPLGEMNRHIIVAMLDPDNIQAVDFLTN